ncbi:MAG: HEAT repeat domain-containing protein, partial [Planctomycetaceae bacterium]|nr:HEAT repeat domain-containing protein [Planctomycetaceae bacterium]
MYYLAFLVLLFFAPCVCADVFILKNAGKIEGELLNTTEIPRKTYRIKTVDNAEIEIEAKHIDRVRKGEREASAEYKAFAPFEEDTVESHLRLSQWCRENNLPELVKKHLQCILVLDSDHKEARQQLGYTKNRDGSWTTRQELLDRSGYVRDKTGSLKTQQQIDAEEILEKQKRALVYWEKRIAQMRQVLPGDTKARNEILAISEPEATKALTDALSSERNEDTRILIIRALSNIGTLGALNTIARWAVSREEPVRSVRETCFEELKKHPDALPAIIGLYISRLNPDNNDNTTINLAAFALGQLDAKTSVPYLIDALETVHRQ